MLAITFRIPFPETFGFGLVCLILLFRIVIMPAIAVLRDETGNKAIKTLFFPELCLLYLLKLPFRFIVFVMSGFKSTEKDKCDQKTQHKCDICKDTGEVLIQNTFLTDTRSLWQKMKGSGTEVYRECTCRKQRSPEDVS